MSNVPFDDVDPAWWAEKIKPVAHEYCPTCEPDVDPTRECVVVSYCHNHDPQLSSRLQGSADNLVTPPYVAPVTENIGEDLT